MDINALLKLLEENKQCLTDMLNDCDNSSAELMLLASKMGPLLDDFVVSQEKLLSSLSSTTIVKYDSDEAVNKPSNE